MPKAFITSPQNYELENYQKKGTVTFADNKEVKLQEQIKSIIYSMPSYDICKQAAFNIGLPTYLLDFQGIIKQTAGKQNQLNRSQIYQQLKNLQKEAIRLRKSTIFTEQSINKQSVRYTIRRMTAKKQTLKQTQFVQKQIESDSQQQLKAALLEELAFRKKKNRFYSTQKLQRKQTYLKERIEKAKTLNKKALKVFKNHKEKEERSYDFFKIETLYSPEMKYTKKLEIPPVLREKKDVFEQYLNVEKEHFLLKVSVLPDEVNNPSETCKTAVSKRREREFLTTCQERNSSKDDRFEEYRKRERAIQLKRRQLEREKEELSLYRAIKKQQRINQLHSPEVKKERLQKQLIKAQSQLLLTHKHSSQQPAQKPKEQVIDDQNQIKAKCQQRQFKRQMQLQERVNNIREEFKIQEQRRERHRLNKSLQHQEKIHLNQTLIRTFLNRFKPVKQQQTRHEMTIKMRHQQLKQKENYDKMANSVSKLTEQQIAKQLSRIRKRQIEKEKQRMNLVV